MLGLVLGALLVAGALTAVGALVGVAVPWPARLVVAVALLAVLAAVELTGRAKLLPQNRRLVPQTIVTSDRLTGPLQFGFEMGTGMRTFAPSALPLAVVVMMVLWSPDLVHGLVVGVGFGLGRALAIPARRPDPDRWDRRIAAANAPIRLLLLLAFVAIVVPLASGVSA